MFQIFARNWWREDSNGRLIPDPRARKTTWGEVSTESEAQEICADFNNGPRTSRQVRLSYKYEYRRI